MLRYYLASLKQCCHQSRDFLLEMKHQPVLLLNNLLILYTVACASPAMGHWGTCSFWLPTITF